jgi:hypothetical protein
MRRVATPSIPTSMYRHFAVITLILTFSLAMFADGENRETVAAEAQPQRPVQPAQPPHFTTAHELDTQARAFARDMSADFDNSFGRPMERLVGSRGGGLVSEEPPVAAPQTGYSSEYLASLSQAEREQLLSQLREAGLPLPGVQPR